MLRVLVYAVCILLIASPLAEAQRTEKNPLLSVLPRFRNLGALRLSPSETQVAARTFSQAPPSGLPGRGLAQHPMLYAGEGDNTMYVVDGGKIIWTYQTGPGWEYDDVWMLSNGNILFSRMQYAAEITPEKKVVWRYDAPPGTEIHTCQPIGRDKVMFVLNGLPPRLMVVNILTNAVETDHVLPAPSETEAKTVHGQFRRARYTASGTYLVAFLEMNQVVEYDKNFKEVWKYPVRSPWAAVRLSNGNTLITDEQDNITMEVTQDKRIVWQVVPSDLPEPYRYRNTQSATRLADGNTIICSRGGNDHGPQLVEVTPEKRVVWVLQDWSQLGPATAVQVLDEPGDPEVPGTSLH